MTEYFEISDIKFSVPDRGKPLVPSDLTVNFELDQENAALLIADLTRRFPDVPKWIVRQNKNLMRLRLQNSRQLRGGNYYRASLYLQRVAIESLRLRPLEKTRAAEKLALRAVTARQQRNVRSRFGQDFYIRQDHHKYSIGAFRLGLLRDWIEPWPRSEEMLGRLQCGQATRRDMEAVIRIFEEVEDTENAKVLRSIVESGGGPLDMPRLQLMTDQALAWRVCECTKRGDPGGMADAYEALIARLGRDKAELLLTPCRQALGICGSSREPT